MYAPTPMFNPFSAKDRDRIITAFEMNQYYSHYAAFVAFLFNTGCRPSEAIALQWKHINHDITRLSFAQAAIQTAGGRKIRSGLKTQESRTFPINAKVTELLESIKPEDCAPEALVFPSPRGGLIDFHNFRNRAWVSILESLPDIRYRKPYQTRHTFITLELENGLAVQDVARLVGNSPEIVYQHYAGNKRDLLVPEF